MIPCQVFSALGAAWKFGGARGILRFGLRIDRIIEVSTDRDGQSGAV